MGARGTASGAGLMPDKGWRRRFDEPVPLPRGRQLVTLKDAADYVMKLPKAEHGQSDGVLG